LPLWAGLAFTRV